MIVNAEMISRDTFRSHVWLFEIECSKKRKEREKRKLGISKKTLDRKEEKFRER